ncbi:HIT domain-containing protein [Thalassotalea eurytherma]|uniref:HIT domain-containing protein n=1 Tax=Thalassotalea eurytherma TaxID=1144278 RepID=A0ABQ6H434_9GAMM|nr:HIT domain-containing protein [Thalassotalea eurytherma]GLX81572.1 hypothetical protein theurythT_10240 [Thalassotalea eurytherma]
MTTQTSFELHEMLAADTVLIKELPLSNLMLMNNANHPWCILVPRVADVNDVYQLDWQDQQQLLNESSMLCEVMMQLFKGKKMNVAALGNMCPQLHVHHIVRFEGDIDWPHPVWGRSSCVSYSSEKITDIKAQLLSVIDTIID